MFDKRLLVQLVSQLNEDLDEVEARGSGGSILTYVGVFQLVSFYQQTHLMQTIESNRISILVNTDTEVEWAMSIKLLSPVFVYPCDNN